MASSAALPVLLFFAAVSPAPGQDRDAVLAKVKTAAAEYSASLEDFTCTQLTVRSVDRTGSGNRWSVLETVEQELDFVGHKEHYKVTKVNGQPAGAKNLVKHRYFRSSGEFGSALKGVFDPEVKAEFSWERAEDAPEGEVCVFRYRVDEANSKYMMHINSVTNVGPVRVSRRNEAFPLGHHGVVYAACDTGRVMRLQFETDPRGNDTGGTKVDIRYARTAIGSKTFLLPQSAEEMNQFHRTLTKIDIRFEDYRKYDATSTVRFEDKQ